MDNHYRLSQTLKNGQTWTSRLYHLTWNLIFHIWEDRNNQLHETERIKDFEGAEILKQSIIKEWNQGIGHLPASEFSKLFQTNLDTLLAKNLEYQQHWFIVIRQGRILLDPTNVISDEFETSTALQKWLGISYNIKDKEALPMLKESITIEWTTGLSILPPLQYQQYFDTTLQTLLNTSIKYLKHWLHTIRKGRTRFDPTNVINNEFNYPGATRNWFEN